MQQTYEEVERRRRRIESEVRWAERQVAMYEEAGQAYAAQFARMMLAASRSELQQFDAEYPQA